MMMLLWTLIVLSWARGLTGIILEGSQTSYAQFHQWHGEANATLSLEFRTSQSNALLLYTDHKKSGQYLQLTLAGGRVRMRYNFGPSVRNGFITVPSGPQDGVVFNDGNWHQLVVARRADQVILLVDAEFQTTSSPSPDLLSHEGFGNSSSNSFVYVGGLPAWYSGEKAETLLSLPTVLLEPRLRGGIRRLKYRDAAGDQVRNQKMMAFRVSMKFCID